MWYVPIAVLLFMLALFFIKEAKASKGTAKNEVRLLIVLGCRVRGEKAEPTLQMRIKKAEEYMKEHKNTLAIVCGGIVHKDQYKSEAQVMLEELTRAGIEKDRIIKEDKSLTTVQNFLNAKKILADLEISHSDAAILSSEFHLMRARVIAKRCGINAETLPAPSPKKEKIKNYIRELIAFPTAYIQTKGVK